MADLGVDHAHDKLRYFEMTPECAQTFITKRESTT